MTAATGIANQAIAINGIRERSRAISRNMDANPLSCAATRRENTQVRRAWLSLRQGKAVAFLIKTDGELGGRGPCVRFGQVRVMNVLL